MSRHEKLLARLLQHPLATDFRWAELVTLLEGYDCVLHESGGGSSHKYFVHDSGKKLNTFRPHPGGIMKPYQLRATRKFLLDLGLIENG